MDPIENSHSFMGAGMVSIVSPILDALDNGWTYVVIGGLCISIIGFFKLAVRLSRLSSLVGRGKIAHLRYFSDYFLSASTPTILMRLLITVHLRGIRPRLDIWDGEQAWINTGCRTQDHVLVVDRTLQYTVLEYSAKDCSCI